MSRRKVHIKVMFFLCFCGVLDGAFHTLKSWHVGICGVVGWDGGVGMHPSCFHRGGGVGGSGIEMNYSPGLLSLRNWAKVITFAESAAHLVSGRCLEVSRTITYLN